MGWPDVVSANHLAAYDYRCEQRLKGLKHRRLDLESKMALLKEEFLEKQDITASTLLYDEDDADEWYNSAIIEEGVFESK